MASKITGEGVYIGCGKPRTIMGETNQTCSPCCNVAMMLCYEEDAVTQRVDPRVPDKTVTTVLNACTYYECVECGQRYEHAGEAFEICTS